MNSLLFLPYILIIRAGYLVEPVPEYGLQKGDTLLNQWIFHTIESPMAQYIFASVLIFFQTLSINRLVIKHRLAYQITLIPGLIYILFTALIPEIGVWSPQLIANTFIIMSLSELFLIYKRPQAAAIIFNIGFWFGIASLFVPSIILFFFFSIVGLLILRSIKLKEIFQLLVGLLTPVFLYSAIVYLINGSLTNILNKYAWTFNYQIIQVNSIASFIYIAIALLSVFCILSYRQYTIKKSIQAQKKIDILFWLMMFSGLFALTSNTMHPSTLVLFFIPLSSLISTNFLNIKNTLIQEVIHVSFIVAIFMIHFKGISF